MTDNDEKADYRRLWLKSQITILEQRNRIEQLECLIGRIKNLVNGERSRQEKER